MKKGQIAHIDRDHTNSARANAAFLCREHHDEYDTTSRQSKGHTPAELKKYQKELQVALPTLLLSAVSTTSEPKGTGVSIDLYNLRVPTYAATLKFLKRVTNFVPLDLPPLYEFADDTNRAMFLFDAKLARKLGLMFNKAVHLHEIERQKNPRDWTKELQAEETKIRAWFWDRLAELRHTFAPYLRLK